MIDFTIETEIDLPAAEVFTYVTDPTKLPSWQENTVSVVQEGDGPLQVGTRLREVHRAPGAKEVASLLEVSELELDRIFALRVLEGPLPIDARITLEPIEGGTLLRFAGHGQPRGTMRLLQPLLRLRLKRQFATHCAALKSMMEDELATVDSAAA